MENVEKKQGIAYLEEQKYSEAIALYVKNIQTNPSEISNYWYIGLAMLLQGKETEAKQTWNSVMARANPVQLKQWRSQLVEILSAEAARREGIGDWQNALLLRQQITAIAPDLFNNLLATILLYLKLQNLNNSLKNSLYKATELLSSKQYSELDRQLLLQVLETFGQAKVFYIKALDLFETCLDAHLVTGTSPRIINLKKIYAVIYSNKVMRHCENGEFELAILSYWKALELNPDLSSVYFNLGMAFFGLGNFNEAAELFQKVEETDKNFHTANQILSKIYTSNAGEILGNFYIQIYYQNWDRFKYSQAATIAKRMIKLRPQSPEAYYDRAIALYYDGIFNHKPHNFDEAELNFKQVLELQPNSSEAETQLATIPYMKVFASKGYSISADCFSSVMALWEKYLNRFADLPQIEFLEIGCFEGMATCWLLDNILTHESAKITCIDIFEGVIDEKKQDTNTRKSVEKRFDWNIERSGASQKVRKIVGFSQTVLRSLPVNAYNAIYIDGSHLGSDVLQDAVLSWGLVKQGGLIIFDDYHFEFPNHPHQNTRVGIDAFLTVFQDKIKIIYKGDRQVFLEKIAE